jgi:7-carboxy-7-deazaguanine synthase
MALNTLDISDDFVFYTLEGEGEHIGKPSVFMRLARCNLTCIGFKSPDAPYGCDSYISWSIKNPLTFDEIVDKYFIDTGYATKLKDGAILKLTGGEPLVQQKKLYQFIVYLTKRLGFGIRIDFETNATIMPDLDWLNMERNAPCTFTTSPKLSSNGDPESKTYKPDVLRWHARAGSGFKFVITSDKDIEEIWRKYVEDEHGIHVRRDRIWFMPACGSRAEHIERAPAVAEYAKAMNVNFSPRLHLLVWDKALKV